MDKKTGFEGITKGKNLLAFKDSKSKGELPYWV